MEDELRTLYELCETISRELADANDKIHQAGGKLSSGDVDYINKLTHSMKSIKTTIAMMEAEDGGYSNRGRSYNDGRSYSDGRSYNSYRGNSYDPNGYDADGEYRRGRSYRRDM